MGREGAPLTPRCQCRINAECARIDRHISIFATVSVVAVRVRTSVDRDEAQQYGDRACRERAECTFHFGSIPIDLNSINF